MALSLYIVIIIIVASSPKAESNPDAKRLYDDLLSTYNRHIRPVFNNTDVIVLKLGLRLSSLIGLNLKDQILSTNVWLQQEWSDHKFRWDPAEYGGVTELYVPSENIWLPDVVLYNNADGEFVITTMTKAILSSDGTVNWEPPAIFKSSCEINIRYYPYDVQTCFMKLGTWTHDGSQITLCHIGEEPTVSKVELGIDLKEYYPSIEWDILSVPAERHIEFYPCCTTPYYDIFFNITLRRKSLFYTVNLIIPVVGISYLSILVFYLPADSGEKITLSISVLLAQTMFFLLMSEIMPSTSIDIPLLGRYLLFSIILVSLSIVITTIVLNVHYRNPSTHHMSPWVREFFIERMAKILCLRSARSAAKSDAKGDTKPAQEQNNTPPNQGLVSSDVMYGFPPKRPGFNFPNMQNRAKVVKDHQRYATRGGHENRTQWQRCQKEIKRAADNVAQIQNHNKRQDEFDQEDNDWGLVAMVLDRIFLIIFNSAFIVATLTILLDAPSLSDNSEAIDRSISTIVNKKLHPPMQQEQLERLTSI